MGNVFTVGSLYAGIGGICLGFKNSGFKIEWANEYDKFASITYRENFEHPLIEGDVMSLDIKKLKPVDVLAGGFPCQPFSVAGYRKGFDDNRGNHFFRMLDFVDEMRPKVLFFENVKNLVGHDKGNTFRVIKNEIISRNYSFHSKVLNTKDYGNIPHNRERIFIISFDLDVYPNSYELWDFPREELLDTTINDILDTGRVEDKYYYKESTYMYNDLIRDMKREDTIYQWRRKYVRENKSNVCPTLTANMGTGGHNVPLVKTEYGIRKLTPRECLRFQGFPDTFKLPEGVGVSQFYKQTGNSVSVPVIQRLSSNILKVLGGISCRNQLEIFNQN